MEYDEGENVTDFNTDYRPSQSMHFIFHQIIFVLFSIVGMCANVVIIYTILRFNRVRTTANMFLVNWAIADFCSLLVAPSGYRIISILDNIVMSSESRCTLLHIGATLQFTVVLFVLLVLIDWIMEAFFEKASEKFRMYHKYIIGALWIISLLISGITSGYCLADIWSVFPVFMILIGFGLLILIVIVLQCTRAVRKFLLKKPLDHPTVMLTLATSFVGCWILGFCMFIVIDAAMLHPIISVIAECLIFSSAIVNFGLLCRLNTDFQACFLQAFKRSSNKYEDSVCSFDNPIVRNMNYINHKDSVQISFHNPDEGLLASEY